MRRALLLASSLLAAAMGCGLLLPDVGDDASQGADGGEGGRPGDGGSGGDARAADAGFDPCTASDAGPAATTAFGGLFVVGGYAVTDVADAAVSRDVLRATIYCDGHLGDFVVAAELPDVRLGPAAGVVNGFLLVVSGTTLDGGLTSEAYVAKLASDGGVGAFQTVSSVDAGVRQEAQYASNGTALALMGGFVDQGSQPLGSVDVVRVTNEGDIHVFSQGNMPSSRASGQAAYADGVVFVGGGGGGSGQGLPAAEATMSQDGTFGAWRQVGEESDPITYGVALATSDTCFFIGRPGGMNGTACAEYVVTAGAAPTESKVAPPDENIVTAHGAAVVAHGFAYFVGGTDNDGRGISDGKSITVDHLSTSTTSIATLPLLPYGRFGHALVVY